MWRPRRSKLELGNIWDTMVVPGGTRWVSGDILWWYSAVPRPTCGVVFWPKLRCLLKCPVESLGLDTL